MRLSAGGGGAGGGVNRFQRSQVHPSVNGKRHNASRQHRQQGPVFLVPKLPLGTPSPKLRFAAVPIRLLELSQPCWVLTSINSPGKVTAVVGGPSSRSHIEPAPRVAPRARPGSRRVARLLPTPAGPAAPARFPASSAGDRAACPGRPGTGRRLPRR